MHATILKRSAVNVSDVATVHPKAPLRTSAPNCAAKPKATLVEHAGRPVAIQITCGCGETTTVELEFPAENTAQNNTEPKS